MTPIVIGVHDKYRIAWNVDLNHNSLEFDDMFNSDNPNVNSIKNTHRQ